MFSIIIPAYQEEERLPRLLESLKNQVFEKYETIIVSPCPEGKIAKLSRGLDFSLVEDEGKGPAHARNLGASSSTQPYLFFLDADAYLPHKDFLKIVQEDIIKQKIKFATFKGFFYDRGSLDNLTFKISNRVMELKSKFSPHVFEFATLIKSDLFRRAGGFPENYKVGEGHGLANRVVEETNEELHVFSRPKIGVSGRRIEKEGRIRLYLKILWSELNLTFGRAENLQKMKYSFEHKPQD